MPACRKCAYLLDEGETSERCPNCGTLLREREPEPVLPVTLGTVWRRGAGEPSPTESRDPDPAVPEDRRAGPGDRSHEAVPGDRPAETVKPAEKPTAPLITSLPRGAVPGAPRAARRGTGFYPAVPDEPVKPAVFAPPRAAEAVPKDRPFAAPGSVTTAGVASGALAPGPIAAGERESPSATPAATEREPGPLAAAPTLASTLPGTGEPAAAERERDPLATAATLIDVTPRAATERDPLTAAPTLVGPLAGAVTERERGPLATAVTLVETPAPGPITAGPEWARGSVMPTLVGTLAEGPIQAGAGWPRDSPTLSGTSDRVVPERERGPGALAPTLSGTSDRVVPERERGPGALAPTLSGTEAGGERAPARVVTARVRRGGVDDSGAVIPSLISAPRGEPRRKQAPADADGDHDDLPAPVASSRPFTMPKIVKRIAVPAATAATTDLDSSAELDLPQLAAVTNLPVIETVVASPRPPGSTRPDDVDLDLDDLHGEPSEPPVVPAPTSGPEAGSSSSRNSLRPSMRPRPRRLASRAAQPPPPAIAYVGLVGLAAGLIGLWWFFFTRTPGLAIDERAQPARTDMSRATWSESYLEAQTARLDADRVSDYLTALVEAETQGDRLGRAEAALCMHLRYGPDAVRRSAAAVWRTQAVAEDPRVARVAGLAALADGDLAAAERLLAGSDDPRARLYRALTARARGDERTAMREAEQVLTQRPGDVAAALVLTTATLAARRDAPLGPLQDAAAAHADHPLHQQALLRALLDRGRLEAARRLAETMPRVAGASAAHQARLVILRAEVAAATGEFGKARWVSEEALHLAPTDAATQLARVRLLLTAGDLGRVQQEIGPLLRNVPVDPEASVLQAELAIAAGNESTATRAIDRLSAAEGERGRVALLRGRVHVMRGRSDDAIAAFTEALADDPANVAAAIALAELRVRAGASDPLASIVRAHTLLGQDPRAAVRPGLRALARAHADLLVETGRKDQAIAVLDAALADDPDDNSAQLRRGVLALEQGRGAAGRADLAAVFERTGGYPGLVGPLGRLYLRDGDLAGLAELVQPHAADPDAPDDVVLMNALLRLAQGDRDAADSNVEKVLQRSPGSWEAHLVKARVLYERDRNAEAATEIRLARPRSPDAEVELWTGKIAERGGKLGDAVIAYRRARQQDPGLLEAGFLLGRALLAQGLAREAVTELQAVTRAAEVPPGAHLALGLALREREQLPEALQSFIHAVDHDPNPDEALYWAGRTAAELGRHAEAVPRLGRAVALAGVGTAWQADAQLWLGRSLHRLGRRPESRAAFTAYLQLAGDKATARPEVERLMRER